MMKTAIITGGSQGLGKAIAKKLADQGYSVILIARRESFLQQAQAEIGEKASYYVCDIRNKIEVEATISKIKASYPTIDVLINNAGVWTEDSLQEENPNLLASAIETNLMGHIFMTEACLGLLKHDSTARIFNVISTAGVLGIPAGDNTAWKTYGASKWGIRGYTNALREQLRNTNIQVLQFFPGGFESNLYENAGRDNPHNQPWMMHVDDVADIAIFAITRPDDVYMEQVVVSKTVK